MRKFLLLFAALLLVSAVWAQDEQPVQRLNVHMMDGTVYILTPDGRYYTLLGLPGRKE